VYGHTFFILLRNKSLL